MPAVLLLRHAVPVELQVPQVDGRAVAHQDVGGDSAHGERVASVGAGEGLVVGGVLVDLLRADLGTLRFVHHGMLGGDPGPAEDLSRRRVEPVEHDSAVEVRRSSRGGIRHAVLNEHAPVHGPDRFDLVQRHRVQVAGGRVESPHQLAVGQAQGVDPTVGGAEQHQPLVDGRRGIHPPAGCEMPTRLAVAGVQRHDAVVLDRR